MHTIYQEDAPSEMTDYVLAMYDPSEKAHEATCRPVGRHSVSYLRSKDLIYIISYRR